MTIRPLVLAALFALSTPAFGIPINYGFDGSVGYCGGLPDCSVSGRFSIDPTLDLDPTPNVGRYSGSGLAITLGGVVLPMVPTFDVYVRNDDFGAFCGFGAGQQRRDMITVVGSQVVGGQGAHASAVFDVCNSSALTSDSLMGADLNAFGPYRTGPGQGIVLAGLGLLPPEKFPNPTAFPEAFGNTTRIYALPPIAPLVIPEPGSLPLLLGALAVLASLGWRATGVKK